MSMLAIHPGAAYHVESLEGARYARYFDALVRPEDLGSLELSKFDIIVVPCRTPAHRIMPHSMQLKAYLDSGGTLFASGESHSELWLPGIQFFPQPTNWWWWLDPNADLGVRIVHPSHPLVHHLCQADVTWHIHGTFIAPAHAEVLIADAESRPILYVDETTTHGRMIVTSLDPFYHHGSHFMPATTRFLDGFLPALQDLHPRSKSAAAHVGQPGYA
jgi:hypothetical protein